MVIKKIHFFSGFLIAAFVGLHLFNHVWSIFGIDAHIQLMNALRSFYRHPLIESILLLAVGMQIVSGLRLFAAKRYTLGSPFEKLQIWSGLYMAFFLVIHVSAVFTGRWVLKLDTNFFFGAAGILSFPANLFFVPYYALAILSFFAHLASIHKLKMHKWLLGFSPAQQSIGIIGLGVLVTLLVFWGMTQGLKGFDLPPAYKILTGNFLAS